MKPTYESPLASRYASRYMLHLFSPDSRFETWRKLWVALARAEHELGLPVTQAQVDELAAHISPIDYDIVSKKEKEIRHDVMAHIYAYGVDAPGAKGIIHLGATSCYVTDNADLILYRDGLRYLEGNLEGDVLSADTGPSPHDHDCSPRHGRRHDHFAAAGRSVVRLQKRDV